MAMLGNPFLRHKKHPRGAMAVIYLLLLGLLALDALVLLVGRNLYFVIRLRFSITGTTNAYLGGFLLIGTVFSIFIHLVATERALIDLEFPRRVLLSVSRVAGVLLTAIGVLQTALVLLVPGFAGNIWPLSIAVLALAAGIGLFVLRTRYGDAPKTNRLR